MKAIVLLALFCAFSITVMAVDTQSIIEKYADYNAVLTEKESFYLIDIKDDKLFIEETINKQMLVLNEYSKEFTSDYIYYNGFMTIKDKEAYTQVPEGKKYNKIKVSQFKELSNQSGSSFYDDGKSLQFSYPSLQKGAIASLSYTVNYNDPHFLNKYFFQSIIPVLKSKISIKVHPDVKIGFKMFNGENANIQFREFKKGKYKILEWTVEDIEAFKYLRADQYSLSYHSPHLVLYIDEVNINDSVQNYFGTVDDLYRFSSGFAAQTKNESNEELKQLVSELTEGLSDTEKAKVIYYWVQNNIKYIAYEEGYMGFIPAPANEVFTKRYGDCKGMSSLIREMMTIAGLPSYLTWVGTRSIPYTYNDLPLPSVDNHMIASYIENDSVCVLDATFKYLDYGVFPYHIQNKEILIGLDDDSYKIFTVPIAPSDKNRIIDSVKLSIDGKGLIGKGNRVQRGYNKVELAYAMDGAKIEKYNKNLSRLFNKGSNKFNITDNTVNNIFERDREASIEYDFQLLDYCKSIGDEIYVNMNLTKSYQGLVIDTANLLAPIENDFHFKESYITSLEIPEGYQVSYMPNDGSFSEDEFNFDISYREKDNQVVMTYNIEFEFLLLLKDDIPRWNKMIKALNKHYRSSIVLKKIS